MTYVPRDQNSRADILTKLASTKNHGHNRTVIQETLEVTRTNAIMVRAIENNIEGWITPIKSYHLKGELPEDESEARKIRIISTKFTVVPDKLYKMGKSVPMLRCLNKRETCLVLMEVHEGICKSQIGGRALANKLLRQYGICKEM